MASVQEKTYLALLGWDKVEGLELILWSLMRRKKILVITPAGLPSYLGVLRHIFFVNRYIKASAEEYKASLDQYKKGLFYEVNIEAIDLTIKFYNRQIKDRIKLIGYYNKLLNTNKFEAYVKKQISYQIFAILRSLHLVRLSSFKQNEILLVKSPINEFVVEYMQDKYRVMYQIKWIFPAWRPFLLFGYYGWLFMEWIRRGVVLNKDRKNYKISKEAAWGFYRKTLRDDVIIDNNRFEINDMLILEFVTKDYQRLKAFEKAKERGFHTASVPKLKINVNKNIFNILFFYFLAPLTACIQLFLTGQSYLLYYILLFHKRCFPVEILMNLYRIKCHISVIDYDDIDTTIILNKYGAKNAIFHWSDVVDFKANSHALIAHNIYFGWGNMNYFHHSHNLYVDKKVKIGCIFKEEFNKAVCNKENIIKRIPRLKNGKKIVAFFDCSFSDAILFTVKFFLQYLEVIKEYCKTNKDINVLLKPKSEEKYVLENLQDNLAQYTKLWKEIKSCENFNYLNPLNWNIEEAIAVADVCIAMGMTSPSTIALICGKNALYFDNTGNVYHPFAKKYKNSIVFEDKNLLFQQIADILNGSFSCKDVISEGEIREYDAFDDDKALERLRDNLYELTGDPV